MQYEYTKQTIDLSASMNPFIWVVHVWYSYLSTSVYPSIMYPCIQGLVDGWTCGQRNRWDGWMVGGMDGINLMREMDVTDGMDEWMDGWININWWMRWKEIWYVTASAKQHFDCQLPVFFHWWLSLLALLFSGMSLCGKVIGCKLNLYMIRYPTNFFELQHLESKKLWNATGGFFDMACQLGNLWTFYTCTMWYQVAPGGTTTDK